MDEQTAPDGEPDYRFSLANERTFLAWVRTSLGLLAGGVAVGQLTPPGPGGGHLTGVVLAGVCILLAAFLAVGALLRHRVVQQAMRAGRPLPAALMVPVVTVGVGVTAVLSAVLVLSG